MLGRGTCGTRRWLECSWRTCDARRGGWNTWSWLWCLGVVVGIRCVRWNVPGVLWKISHRLIFCDRGADFLAGSFF